jgi:ATP-binding cassette subfamily B protein
MTLFRNPRRRRLLVPEVVQTSAMDCGPAVLKCLLEGYGIPVSYGRLREACQTDVDGTSIDVLEAVAGRLGLVAEQVMLPVDHLLLPEADALPAVLVVRLPNDFTHFVLVWRRHGPLVQVMDPALGRRWLTGRQLLDDVYVHTARVPAEGWREWAGSDDFRRPLAARLRALGCGRDGATLLDKASGSTTWRPLALVDAAARFTESLAGAGGLRRGGEARRFLRVLVERGQEAAPELGPVIPDSSWSVRPAPPDEEGDEQLFLRGAVLIRVRGRSSPAGAPAAATAALPRELAVALKEPAPRPVRVLCGLLRGTGRLNLLLLGVALALAAGGSVVEAVLLRGLLDVRHDLGLTEQRLGAVGFFLAFGVAVLLLELAVAHDLLGLGRRLEVRLRLAFLRKIPRLHDRYFQSRPTSDMAERGHSIRQVRQLPRLAGQFLRAGLTLLLTAGAIAWLDPAGAPLAVAAAVAAACLPVAFNPLLQGLDLRVRTHAGALSRFYLDALLGLGAVRAHGAERAVRREHEGLLVDWARASRRLLGWLVAVEGLQMAAGIGLTGWLLLLHAGRASDVAAALLLAYWALNLPVLGDEIGLVCRQYPGLRNITLRLLEPLGAPEDAPPAESVARDAAASGGVAISLEEVTVRAAGHTILAEVNVQIPAGSHVAVVGASGAGKSTLAGLLLGWHRAAAGRVLVDGVPLDAARMDRLRTETAWVDPAVQLWNRSLVENLLYGSPAGGASVGAALHDADLYGVLQRLPDGLQTALGEGGGLLSGGEGQRVRLGRAFHRAGVRLAVLDEPFRGLDRDQRHRLLQRARRAWRDTTLVCITHDVGETRDFERVLVIDAGRVVEDGCPADLAADPGSRYRALLDAEAAVRRGLWATTRWRRMRLDSGRLVPDGGEEA